MSMTLSLELRICLALSLWTLFWCCISSFLWVSNVFCLEVKISVSKVRGWTSAGVPLAMFKCCLPSIVSSISRLASLESAVQMARAMLLRLESLDGWELASCFRMWFRVVVLASWVRILRRWSWEVVSYLVKSWALMERFSCCSKTLCLAMCFGILWG